MTSIMKPLIWIVVGGLLGGFATYRFVSPKETTPTNSIVTLPASSAGIRALGSIQPHLGIVDVAIPAGFQVSRLEPGVEEGLKVERNAVLAILYGYEERRRELDVLEAEIAAAKLARAIEEENERSALAEIDRERQRAIRPGKLELESLGFKILALEAKDRLSQEQLGKVEGLQNNGTVALNEYDQIRAQSEISREELKFAQAEKARVQEALSQNTSDEKVNEQRHRVQTAAQRARMQSPLETLEKKRKLAEVMRDRCRILAPRDGQILKITSQVGEASVGKPLLRLGDTSRMYVLAEIYQEDRHRAKVGDPALIEGRGLPTRSTGELCGHIQSISPVITPHTQSPIDPTARENARVFEAWIELDLDESKDKEFLEKLRGLCLLPVEVTILPKDTGGEAEGGRPRP